MNDPSEPAVLGAKTGFISVLIFCKELNMTID
jgi:hypothetical protein